MNIKTKTLREITDIILSNIEQEHDLELPYTTYWNNTFNEGLNLSPPEPRVSDLREDWKNLDIVLNKKHKLSELDFERFANIIKAIGSKM